MPCGTQDPTVWQACMTTAMRSGLNRHCCMLATGCERSQMRPRTDWITEWCGVPCSIGGGLPSLPSLELARISATGLGRTQSPALGAAATPRRCCAVSDETGQISTIHWRCWQCGTPQTILGRCTHELEGRAALAIRTESWCDRVRVRVRA